MSSLLQCLLACLVVHPAMLEPMVYPQRNQYVAYNSMEVLNYNCTVQAEKKAIWEVGKVQYITQSQLTQQSGSSGIGLTIIPTPDANSQVSMISISNVTQGNLLLQCVAVPLFGIGAVKGREYLVVSFGQPDAVENLRLVPSDGDLILSWTRPDNVPSEVEILYTLLINNTDTLTSSTNITTANSFSLRYLEDQILNNSVVGLCTMFEFSLTGSNDAGIGPSTTIVDTIPVSPDVTLISKELRVERVNLQPLSVQISFPPVNPCSVNFPLHNYTIEIDNRVIFVQLADDITDENERIYLTLNSTILSGVALDSSFPLTVTACNDITCRTSDPVTLNVTDVQGVEVIYFQDRLFLRCSFADNSRAIGCAVRLSLADSNDTESHEFLRESGVLPCIETVYRLDAYDEVVVIDIEENGMLGNGILTIAVPEEETSEEMYNQVTECPIVSEMVGGLSGATAAIVGGVFGPILAIAVVITIVVPIVVIFVAKKKQRSKPATPAESISTGISYELKQDPIQDDHGGSLPLLEERECSYDSDTKTIVVNVRLVAKMLRIEQNQIKWLKMQQE